MSCNGGNKLLFNLQANWGDIAAMEILKSILLCNVNIEKIVAWKQSKWDGYKYYYIYFTKSIAKNSLIYRRYIGISR